ncbi:hypothetical protein OKA05_14370 [Luteolibacter arcticus]|uniref:Uncharacterized protein n=1 Tax=Luteolibacter arcticus TaxID=1581411 RepID=A0ABT3GJP7_9BACT|nr:hypothetical protein [Luteolibacter arcticus]MCW1923748.1 hypothetical protein [Luteolibacter arcticus]
MKHRICLAWFGDLDVPQRQQSKPKKQSSATPAQSSRRTSQPKVKEAAELRRMFGRD